MSSLQVLAWLLFSRPSWPVRKRYFGSSDGTRRGLADWIIGGSHLWVFPGKFETVSACNLETSFLGVENGLFASFRLLMHFRLLYGRSVWSSKTNQDAALAQIIEACKSIIVLGACAEVAILTENVADTMAMYIHVCSQTPRMLWRATTRHAQYR